MSGLTQGFRVGFNPQKLWNEDLISGSATQFIHDKNHIQHMQEWILKLHKREHIAGPFDKNYKFPFGKLLLAPLFAIPNQIINGAL